MKLINRQITSSAQKLLHSENFLKKALTPEFDNVISEVLGSERIGKVFAVRNSKGLVKNRSDNLRVIPQEFPSDSEWVVIDTETEYIRVHNVPLPDNRGLLQVGLVLDRNFIAWRVIDKALVFFVCSMVAVLFLASALLTLLLLSPLRSLVRFLGDTTMDLDGLKNVNALPPPLLRYTYGFWSKSDEFGRLVSTVQKLISRINKNYKLSRRWTLQMAHELKTPLAVISAITEAKKRAGEIPHSHAEEVMIEVSEMSKTINEFLDWAELENVTSQQDIHSIKIAKIVRSVCARLERLEPERIDLKLIEDFTVFASPAHLDQLVTNLISNALKYSDKNTSVAVGVSSHELRVRDQGRGIPDEVTERLGEPFNVGVGEKSSKGSGLGLAWVCTISKLYGWDFRLDPSGKGTEAVVNFATSKHRLEKTYPAQF